MSDELPKAKEFMNKSLETINSNLTMTEAIEFLLKHSVSNAPVVKEEDGKLKLVGIVSQSDCLEFLSNQAYFHGRELTVNDMMTRHLYCISPEADIFSIASIFAQKRYRHIPVIDENNNLLGNVSRADILKALHDFYKKESKDETSKKFPPDLSQIINHRFIVGK